MRKVLKVSNMFAWTKRKSIKRMKVAQIVVSVMRHMCVIFIFGVFMAVDTIDMSMIVSAVIVTVIAVIYLILILIAGIQSVKVTVSFVVFANVYAHQRAVIMMEVIVQMIMMAVVVLQA